MTFSASIVFIFTDSRSLTSFLQTLPALTILGLTGSVYAIAIISPRIRPPNPDIVVGAEELESDLRQELHGRYSMQGKGMREQTYDWSTGHAIPLSAYSPVARILETRM